MVIPVKIYSCESKDKHPMSSGSFFSLAGFPFCTGMTMNVGRTEYTGMTALKS